jgi:hypothetical protein
MLEPTIKPIDIEGALARAQEDAIWAMRGRAIQAHSQLEMSLCLLMATVANMEHDVAGIFFFKILAYRTRCDIIELLLRRKHKRVYSLFWKSFSKEVEKIDQTRNNIVHWHGNVMLDHTGFLGVRLIPQHIWSMDHNTPSLDAAKLGDFIETCNTMARICTAFSCGFGLSADMSADERTTLLSKFQQSLEYPIPINHPLHEFAQEWRIQPQASQE